MVGPMGMVVKAGPWSPPLLLLALSSANSGLHVVTFGPLSDRVTREDLLGLNLITSRRCLYSSSQSS